MNRCYQAITAATDVPSVEIAAVLGLPSTSNAGPRLVIGRREWIALPDLGVSPLNAKTDSGARSSSLHAEEVVLSADRSEVRFVTTNHAGQKIACCAAVARTAWVRNSSGIRGQRIFIQTTAMVAGGFCWQILVSLANRSEMHCPMLLGRRALAGTFLIDPEGVRLLGLRRQLEKLT
jgi:hypothetical protein